ncbi:DEAD/DEAH box helicase family protein [Magnetospirillum gryphiswaldense]|uniref:DEAD/DEAH-box helicase domain-containing protein n=1 Tax=Magnetospirillum gryphiswaldense TaxID=55518 RepID=A4U0V0_9PROT|nr:DEAD/DEAH box helicase family protein [Magnetospirillum gryphiswaldense]AVM75531.1 hypothetical protein MSR1_30640 [Magnetospirillum gryphiswaldense MSR-1]AVM79434.1 hypothetical protein MSR1L_30640 [Magnetospirillum gryphiswaldense]CAM76507.1 conserved hypothetical protein [Magnetospirillum gryphiswaldense MSR-1]
MSGNTINYVDAICGAGKTHGAILYAIDQAANQDAKIAIIQPSRELIQQTEVAMIKQIRSMGLEVPLTTIYSTDDITQGNYVSVSTRIQDHLKKAAEIPTGQILIITHAAFLSLPHWHRKDSWEIIIDEVPNIAPFHRYELEENSDLLKNLARIEPDRGSPAYNKVVVNDRELVEKAILLNNDVFGVFRDLAKNLINPHADIYCLKGQWDRLSTKGNDSIDFFGVVGSSLVKGYSKVTIMGAHFPDSLLAMIWNKEGVRFVENKGIQLRHTDHDIGARQLTVNYLSERSWSKALKRKVGISHSSIGCILPSIQSIMGTSPFIWCANNDLLNQAVDPHFHGAATRISNVSHGINQHQGVHQVLVLSALNLTTDHFKFLEQRFRIDHTEVQKAISHETIYQALMRCSLRDPAATDPVTIIVPDRSLGEWLVRQFKDNGRIKLNRVQTDIPLLETKSGSTSRMGGRPPVNVVAMTNAERESKHRKKKRQIRNGIMAISLGLRGVDETPLDSSSVYPSLEVSLIKDIHSAPIDFEVLNNDELISQLKVCWEFKANSKHDNILISPARFVEKEGIDTKRGLENVISVHGIWLDQDDGTLTPDEMNRIFPDIRFVAMNSYSGNKRYFFPTTIPMTLEAYHAIWDIMVTAIETYGYSKDKAASNFHGIDKSKRPACSMFYVPCQAKDPSKSFWVEFPGVDIDPLFFIENYLLPDPTEYVASTAFANPVSDGMKRLREAIARTSNDNEVAKARQVSMVISQWRNAPKGEGSKEFFLLGCRLRDLGLDESSIRQKLNEEAAYARHPDERRKQISRIVASVIKDGHHPNASNDHGDDQGLRRKG